MKSIMELVRSVSITNYSSTFDLTNVSFHEDLTVVVGPNGAGKSTFLEGTAKFGTKEEIKNANLSNHDSSLTSTYPSKIPIVSLEFILSEDSNSLLVPVCKRPGVQTLDISDNTFISDSGEMVELHKGLPNNEKSLTITRYANGTQKLNTKNGRYKIETLIAKRIADLQLIGTELIEQAASIGLLDSYVNPHDLDSETWSDKLSIMEDKIDFEEYDEEDDIPLSVEIYEDFEEVTSFVTDLILLRTDITNELPNIQYFDKIPSISNEIPLSDLETETQYRGLLTWGGIDPDEATTAEEAELQRALNSGSEQLTRYLNSYINVDKKVERGLPEAVTDPLEGRFDVECTIENDTINVYIHDSMEETTVPINRKSTGFQWLVSCMLTIFSGVIDPDQTDMFLIDDIGVHLHPDWKINLRKALHEIAGDAQIVYSTHSPFFIDNGSLDQVRVASNESNGTRIQKVSEVRGSKYVHDTLEPLRSVLGAYVSEFLYGANGIVIVEGPTDKKYIECFSELFENSESLPTLNEDVAIINGKGANQIVLANFLEAEQDNYFSIMDNDTDGDDQVQKFSDTGIDPAKYAQLDILPNQNATQNPEIEDLFPSELVCEYAADTLPSIITKTMLLSRFNNRSNMGVIEAIDSVLKQYKQQNDIPEDTKIGKGNICEEIRSLVDETWLYASGEKEETIEDFSELITTINSKLD